MLALTDNAVEAVKGVVSSAGGAAGSGGLRLVAVQHAQEVKVEVSVAALPGEDDEVIEEQGARVFLEPEAASLLEDKVLDANVEQNQVEFTIAEQFDE